MISESDLLEGLSEHYKEVIQKFFDYSQHQTSLGVKEINSQTDQATGVWLSTQNTFSQSEVEKIINEVKEESVSIFKKEIKTQNYSLCELLRQIFLSLEERAITIDLDLSKIENIDIINKLDFLEKKKRSLNTLKPSLKPIGKKAMEIESVEKLKKKNQELRSKLTTVQKKYAQMMSEKNVLSKKNEELNTSLGEIKNEMENDEEKKKELEDDISQDSEKNKIKIQELNKDNVTLKNENNSLKEEIKKLKEEANEKVSKTKQYKNLLAILTKKNALINELREKK